MPRILEVEHSAVEGKTDLKVEIRSGGLDMILVLVGFMSRPEREEN